MKSIYFIINPQAKNGYALKVWNKIKKYLDEKRYNYIFYLTNYPGHATEITNEICEKNDGKTKLIVAIGGDGTIHEVVNGAVSSPSVQIGFIPAGSGNDFRRGFNIPKEIFSALLLNLQNESALSFVDIGKIINDEGKKKYFINNSGAGFDAYIAKLVNESKMKKILNRFSLGNLTYAYYVVKELFKYKPKDVNLTIDGKQYFFKKAWFVTVSNQPYYGGGMKIAPKASVTDEIFDVSIVNNLHPLKFLFVFVTVFWGGHLRFKEISTFRGKSIQIETSEPVTAHADGEYIGETPLNIHLLGKEMAIVTSPIE